MKYFAFGSNMNPEQMKNRVGEVNTPMQGTLKGFKLVFNKWAVSRNCCAANLVKTNNPTDIVEGLIYDLNSEQLKKLDKDEGCGAGGIAIRPTSYGRENINVSSNGETVQACIYIAKEGTIEHEHKPNLAYMENLLKGKNFYSTQWYNYLLDQPLCDGSTARDRLNMPAVNIPPQVHLTPPIPQPVAKPRTTTIETNNFDAKQFESKLINARTHRNYGTWQVIKNSIVDYAKKGDSLQEFLARVEQFKKPLQLHFNITTNSKGEITSKGSLLYRFFHFFDSNKHPNAWESLRKFGQNTYGVDINDQRLNNAHQL